ncbi:hypothetical protein pb186bvf_003818 [Paramecium bursaria]
MAFSHLINCLLLTYGPLIAVYKAKNLAEVRAYNYVFYVALICLIAQFSKLFLLASLTVFSEHLLSIQSVFNFIDVYGLWYILRQKSQIDDRQSRTFAVAVGWGVMDATLNHLTTFLFKASQDEFTWVFIQRALTANLEFFEIIAIAFLINKRSTLSYALVALKILVIANVSIIQIRASLTLILFVLTKIVV